MEALMFLVGTCGKNMCNYTAAPTDCSAVYCKGNDMEYGTNSSMCESPMEPKVFVRKCPPNIPCG